MLEAALKSLLPAVTARYRRIVSPTRSAPPGARCSTSLAMQTVSGPPCCTAPPSGARRVCRHFHNRSHPISHCGSGLPAIIETLDRGLGSADSRAIETLRAALPRDPLELERRYPRTAAELFAWGKSWLDTCQQAFADLNVDPNRVHTVATLVPGAMRGLASERQLGSYAGLDLARRGLTNALVAYLQREHQNIKRR
ncbi:hypothetical protein MB901379_01755 [Mycobacterium basiliense]|uniref:Uncharacterized protein n=1 Tax=Mycobacterium basiliense TaxID=2094119 RepID=A0A447GCT5_9MYCO|nr:hypothetical protein MB901379_01755 [Mycobacterium basiliense]